MITNINIFICVNTISALTPEMGADSLLVTTTTIRSQVQLFKPHVQVNALWHKDKSTRFIRVTHVFFQLK